MKLFSRQKEPTYFPILAWNVEQKEFYLYRTPSEIPSGEAIIVLSLNATLETAAVARAAFRLGEENK